MFPTRPIRVSQLKTLRQPMRDPDVVLLHALLNYHLGPPDDQLPVVGTGAADFGPRTEAKVKRFQDVNAIQVGTQFFKDGVVGKETWRVLNQWKAAVFEIQFLPELLLTPPSFPKLPPLLPSFPKLQLPPLLPPSSPNSPTVPLLHFQSIQIKAGESATIPFNDKVTEAHQILVSGVFLLRKNRIFKDVRLGVQDTFHLTSGPLGGSSGSVDKHTISLLGTLSFVDLPVVGNDFVLSTAIQLALIQSALDAKRSVRASATVAANVTLDKDKTGKPTIVGTVSGGFYLDGELPSDKNNNRWKWTAGGTAFGGLSAGIAFP